MRRRETRGYLPCVCLPASLPVSPSSAQQEVHRHTLYRMPGDTRLTGLRRRFFMVSASSCPCLPACASSSEKTEKACGCVWVRVGSRLRA